MDFDPSLELVLRRVRLRARRRAAWLRKLWAEEEGEPGGEMAVSHAAIATHLADLDSPAAEAAWLETDKTVDGWNRELEQTEATLAEDDSSRLAQLNRTFDLSPDEQDILQCCLAMELDPSLGRVYAYLHDHAGRAHVSEALVARLFGHGRESIWNAGSALRRWELVHERDVSPSEPSVLACDPFVRDWLQVGHGLDPCMIGLAEFTPPLEPLPSWPVKETVELITRFLNDEAPGSVRVQIAGPPGSGRRTLAATICATLGLQLLTIDTDRVDAESWPRTHLRAQRQAFLDHLALAWLGTDVAAHRWPRRVPSFPVQLVILEGDQSLPREPDVVDHRVEMPATSIDERRGLWRSYVPVSATWSEQELDELVHRHRATVGEIAAVSQQGVTSPREAAAALRTLTRGRLGKLAQLVECPFRPDDLVVPEYVRQTLEDLVFEAEERAEFWERPEARRLFPQGRGLLALFSGPPGTGKTMAAQVLAASLGLDLFRIDLSTVVSKYVGETSKNLERVLSRAEHIDVVLLFDEADALFGQRTEVKDAHDRFANTDTSYLLQAIESYRGVAVLSTNNKGNIDQAFLRRLRFALEFPMPEVQQRLEIWRRLVRELAGQDRLAASDENGKTVEQNLERLAAVLELSGAQIKYAVLAALFVARRESRPLGLKQLLRGVDRELMKEGRALSQLERERLM